MSITPWSSLNKKVTYTLCASIVVVLVVYGVFLLKSRNGRNLAETTTHSQTNPSNNTNNGSQRGNDTAQPDKKPSPTSTGQKNNPTGTPTPNAQPPATQSPGTSTPANTTTPPTPPPVIIPDWLADINAGNFAQFSLGAQAGNTNATITADSSRAYDGAYSAKAHYGGGTDNNYARAVQGVSWTAGDDVWYGGAFYLPVGFKDAVQGQVALLRWDDFPSYDSGADSCGTLGGLVIFGSDKKARLVNNHYACTSEAENTGGTVLVGPFDIPEGQWVHFDIHQKFSRTNGQALTEVYQNGSLASPSSTNANIGSFTTERLRFGIVAIAAGAQTNPLTLWFDRTYINDSMLGQIGG